MTHQDCPHCTDRSGKPKRLYPTSEDADRAADHSRRARGVELRVYPCDWSRGYLLLPISVHPRLS